MTPSKNIPADRVLAAMIPGEVHAPSDLAARFKTTAAAVRPVLEQLAKDGAVSRVRLQFAKLPSYVIAGTEKPVVQREKYVGVPAGRRTYLPMSGNLTGYDDEIRRRADLCMMVRR
ncbi:hypothetical protein [Burkholderia vietnamiensis]|uniref:hypothetical protein n=1 Tax=Burkholderia vietnamiensis TaxID=60552 RepID=UPI0007575987|nr:hypothetical protein [Burkholderia vietnamiensis]KVR99092.1 hypothetical protein WK29_30580 [Burkholderia vietnamiensis]MCA7984856.1 hypothetical protein [Burkholderia vietnamiensis]HDR8930542.1 hypothetical protein [Burkholderia vietnamiensis]